ncbi:hypothetical protein Asp14428_36060 [Actinoplanes sp. NBRC 14428]|nr:hypothetical protein Asp14428_36060 [Actinoplanes sp. NBRC 14428]
MALEYRLVLAGSTPVELVAERAMPDPADRPTGTPPLLSAALWDQYGFELTVRSGRNGYVEIESAAGTWEWEPKTYVSLTFRMDKFADPDHNVPAMLTAVRRVLESGTEDAALTLNIDTLLLTRFAGDLLKYDQDWWTHSAGADQIIPG